jgi:hypothetical protein
LKPRQTDTPFGPQVEFTGPTSTAPDYLVTTNHNLCDYSFDAMNRSTSVPMTIFGDGFERDPTTGKVVGLDNSGVRFWTLMWDVRRQHGRLNSLAAQKIMSGLYSCDQATGERIEVLEEREGGSPIWGRAFNQGTVSLAGGTANGKVAVLCGRRTEVRWMLGSPSHWQGAWDA